MASSLPRYTHVFGGPASQVVVATPAIHDGHACDVVESWLQDIENGSKFSTIAVGRGQGDEVEFFRAYDRANGRVTRSDHE